MTTVHATVLTHPPTPAPPSGAFPAVIEELRNSNSEAITRECTYVLSNPWAPSVAATEVVAKGLVESGIIEVLCKLISHQTPDSILVVAVEGLYDAVKKGQQVCVCVCGGVHVGVGAARHVKKRQQVGGWGACMCLRMWTCMCENMKRPGQLHFFPVSVLVVFLLPHG